MYDFFEWWLEMFWLVLNWKCLCFSVGYLLKTFERFEWFDLMSFVVEVAILKLHVLYQLFLNHLIGAIWICQFLWFGDCMVFCCSQIWNWRYLFLLEAYLWGGKHSLEWRWVWCSHMTSHLSTLCYSGWLLIDIFVFLVDC